MGLAQWFGWGTSGSEGTLPDIFPLGMAQEEFVKIDVQNIYSKILTDVVDRTQGIPKFAEVSLWDNCLASEKSEGLITLLSKAMALKQELFLVYDKTTQVLRKATAMEEQTIREDYKRQAKSVNGTYISFRNYTCSDMISLYSALEHCTIGALNKNMNLSKAVQLKLKSLRSSVAAIDSADVKAQAVTIATSLKEGRDVMLDAEDQIENATPDLTAVEAALDMLNQKRSFYLGLPASYITGKAPKGLGDSGEGDAKAVERGLKGYFTSIIKPVVETIFGGTCQFKSEDFRQLSTALDTLRTLELVSDELMSMENKLELVNKLFGFPKGTKGGPPEPEVKQLPSGQPS